MKTPGKISSFSSTARRTCRALPGWLLLLTLGWVPVASASDVVFTEGEYSRNGSTVTLSMEEITNDSDYTTGTLRMELFAFGSPYSGDPGSVTSGYRLAVSPGLGTLAANSHFTTSPIVETAAFTAPPDGTYYFTLVLTEYQGSSYDDGYEVVNYVNFADTVTFSTTSASNGASFGFSSAISVGSGYYYDADVGYIYPLGNGFIYVSNLNGYFYVDPGTDFTTGTYLYDFTHESWTYADQSFWPYVYYFDGTGWVDTGFN